MQEKRLGQILVMQLRNANFEIRSRDFEFAAASTPPPPSSRGEGGGGLPYKSDGDARCLALGANCRFSSHFGCLRRKVTIFAHSGIA